MKLALAGVGPWGRLLARKCQEGGAEIVAYARGAGPNVQGLGRRLTIESLCQQDDLAGLIIATPPAVTLRLASIASAAGLAVLATKPLKLAAPLAIRAPFLVDYVRLWSPCYARLKAHIAGHRVRHIRVAFCGPGPIRDFSSLDDYGPHAWAFVHDLLGDQCVVSEVHAEPVRHLDRGATLHRANARAGGVPLDIEVGNGAADRCMRLDVGVERLGTLTYEESGPAASFCVDGVVLQSGPHDPLALMAAQFIAESRGGRCDPRFVHLSVAVTRSLGLIHAAEEPARQRAE